jgi:hypothetical protein
MPIIIDIRKDLRFKQGFQVGMEEGRAINRLIIEQNCIVNMLKKNFGPLELIAECVEVKLAFVVKTKVAYLKAISLLENEEKTTVIAKKTGLMPEVVEKLKTNMD